MATPVSNSVALPAIDSGNGTLIDEFINGLVQGGSWQFGGGPRVLTYSFNINYDYDFDGNLIPGLGGSWTTPLMDAVNRALTEWSNVANISFQNIASGNYFFESNGDIALTLTGNELQPDGAIALGIFPDTAVGAEIRDAAALDGIVYAKPEGDIFFDNYYSGFSYLSADGRTAGFGFDAILHEIGHALGLKHPNDDGGNGRPTFADLGIADLDIARWTIMSNNPNPDSTLEFGNDLSPMPLDILAIQQIYGANMSFHAGNDDYQLGPYIAFGRGEIYKTLWDAGGIDTVRTSGIGNPGIGATIDLRPGIGYVRGETAIPGQAPFTIPSIPPVFNFFAMTYTAIAYNVVIENALGTTFNDWIQGNDVGNLLDGDAGSDQLWGGFGNDTVVGGDGGDALSGQEGDDVLNGGAGVDLLLGGTNNDVLNGGDGDDALFGEDGLDILGGDSGNDVLIGGVGADTLNGGLGADTAIGQEGSDLINGHDGIDLLYGYADNDILNGGFGGDFLSGGLGSDTLIGGDGDDALHGEEGDDLISGDAGNDVLVGSSGNNILNGGAGGDTLIGDTGNDTMNGADDNDQLFGYGGLDSLSGGNGADFLAGGDADDQLQGDAGGDVLDGEAGNDLLNGDADGDNLNGNTGHDTLNGGGGADGMLGWDGDDVLDGGIGNDYIFGDQPIGAGVRGNDRFVFQDGTGNDLVLDFQGGAGAGDVIDLRGMGFAHFSAVISASSNVNGGVFINLDAGNPGGIAGDALFLANIGVAALVADDFLLV